MRKLQKSNFWKRYYKKTRPLREEPWWLRLLDSFLKSSCLNRLEVVDFLLPQGEKLLDIGCGEGEFLFKYAFKKFKEMVGIDISPRLIKKAKRKAARLKMKNVKFKTLDVNSGLPFRNSSFETVTCCALLEHIFSPEELICEIHRVLTKKGVLILEVPNIAFFLHRFTLLFGRFPETAPTQGSLPGIDEEHTRFFTLDSLKKLLGENGFEIKIVSCAGRFSKIRQFWLSFLGADLVVKCLKG